MPAGDLFIVQCEQRTSKGSGKPFHTLRVRKPIVAGKVDEIEAKIWSEAYAKSKGDLTSGKVIACFYEEKEYLGSIQLIIEKYEVRPSDTDLERFKLPPAVNQEEVFQKIFYRQWKDPQIAAFMDTLARALSKGNLKHKLFEIPAGARMHHAYRAGLLAHVEEMMDFAVLLTSGAGLPHYEGYVNQDILLAAIALHDLGKVNDYDPDTLGYNRTRAGAYLSHTSWAAMIVSTMWPRDYSQETMLRLMHAILAHHGKLEYGAPVQPATPEAILLHHIDAMSAQMDVWRSAERASLEGKPPEFSKSLGETPITSCFPK